jgi:mannonate dehydratase
MCSFRIVGGPQRLEEVLVKRRTFAKLAAIPITFGAAPAIMLDPQTPAARMKLGHQHWSDDASLRLLAALGVTHICSAEPSAHFDENWSVEGLVKLRDRVESFGIRLEAVPLPLSSSYITKAENPDIMLGKSPQRDREIDNICQMIRNCGRAGIPMVKYNLTILGVVRSPSTSGRGGARYSTFRYREASQDPPLTEAGPVSSDEMWERITYFLERVVPAAQEAKVRIACHPHDPGMPDQEGFRGVHRVLGSVDGLKRFIEIRPSPYHGINFCQGTVSEMLRDPNREIHDVIRYFGSRKKIFNVHFRNIRGGFLDFQETFPDAGDVDLVSALRTYQSVGYDGMLMPDHAPIIEGDAGGRQAFAFAFGYIRGLLDVVQGREPQQPPVRG